MQSHFWDVSLLGLPVHLNTLIMVAVAMVLVLGLSKLATSTLSVRPDRKQIFAEMIYDFCRNITFSSAGTRGDTFLYYVGSVFVFVLTCNLLGQFPLKIFELPHGELMAPTGDINVPAALGLSTVAMYFFFGLKAKGWKYFQHYLTPLPDLIKGQSFGVALAYIVFFWPFILLNVAEDLTRPGSLMIRLFCNIFVGEILTGVAHSATHFGLPVLVMCIEIFVALIQAYIFAMLTNIYISILSEHHGDDAHHDEVHQNPPHDVKNPALMGATS
ncbi:MAG: F0F1 ATP synthase subunit A [Vampirovibrio sp.]